VLLKKKFQSRLLVPYLFTAFDSGSFKITYSGRFEQFGMETWDFIPDD